MCLNVRCENTRSKVFFYHSIIYFVLLSSEAITLCTDVPDYLTRPVRVLKLINQSLDRSTNRYVNVSSPRVLLYRLLNSKKQVVLKMDKKKKVTNGKK